MHYAIATFLLDKHSRSENTLKLYERVLTDFANFVPDYTRDIGPENIEAYLLQLQHRGYKASTTNLYLRAIQSFYSWLTDEVGIKNIAKKVRALPSLPPKQRALTRKEYLLIEQSTNGYRLDNIAFLCNTGLRVSEYINLKSENFISQDVLRIVGKGRRNRSVPLNDTVKEIMIRNPNLEMIRHRNRIWVFRLCHEASRLLGLIPPFSPHSCRHYFSNELYHRGVPVATISKLLGHADSSITENVYLNWSEESLNGVTDILD